MSDYLEVWAKCFQFNGRLERKAYWIAFLWHMGVVALLTGLDIVFGLFPARPGFTVGTLGLVYLVAAIPANWTSTVRRLHDADFSGWWASLCLVPYIGTPIIMLLCCLRSSGDAIRFDQGQAPVRPNYAILTGGRLAMLERKEGQVESDGV